VTPRPPAAYRGRFAPSPTGPLHFGSLLAALASFLDARAAGGQWLLRIEDLDPPREVPGAADAIQRSLQAHGLLWDGSTRHQSDRSRAYDAALEHLAQSGRLFPCVCTRSVLGPGGSCGGRCTPEPGAPTSQRFRIGAPEGFADLILGPRAAPDGTREDLVLRRRDGLYAYTLAVVVDDADQGITHVVRGADLLPETSVQIDLARALGGGSLPAFGHIPLARNEHGTKLSKQTGAPALDDTRPLENLRAALRGLNQMAADADAGTPQELLDAAICTWSRKRVGTVSDTALVYATDGAP